MKTATILACVCLLAVSCILVTPAEAQLAFARSQVTANGASNGIVSGLDDISNSGSVDQGQYGTAVWSSAAETQGYQVVPVTPARLHIGKVDTQASATAAPAVDGPYVGAGATATAIGWMDWEMQAQQDSSNCVITVFADPTVTRTGDVAAASGICEVEVRIYNFTQSQYYVDELWAFESPPTGNPAPGGGFWQNYTASFNQGDIIQCFIRARSEATAGGNPNPLASNALTRTIVDPIFEVMDYSGQGDCFLVSPNLPIVPEPSTLILLSAGALGLLTYGRRRQHQ